MRIFDFPGIYLGRTGINEYIDIIDEMSLLVCRNPARRDVRHLDMVCVYCHASEIFVSQRISRNTDALTIAASDAFATYVTV